MNFSVIRIPDWAERLSLEADAIIKANYNDENNLAILHNDCRIALIRKSKGQLDPFSPCLRACQELKKMSPAGNRLTDAVLN